MILLEFPFNLPTFVKDWTQETNYIGEYTTGYYHSYCCKNFLSFCNRINISIAYCSYCSKGPGQRSYVDINSWLGIVLTKQVQPGHNSISVILNVRN